jgi:hypothetical protein
MSESARMMLQMLDENRSIEDIIKNSAGSTDSTKTEETKKEDTKTEVKENGENKQETPKDMNLEKKESNPNSDGTPPDNEEVQEHPKLKNKK